MKTRLDTGVIACSLDQEGLSGRRQSWHTLTDRALLDIVRTDRGLRLYFRPDRGIEAELQRLVALERECCTFADWSVQTDDDRVVLAVSAESEEAVAAVHGLSAGLGSASTQSSSHSV